MPTAAIFRSTADKTLFYSICGLFAGFPIAILIYAGIKGEMELGGSLAASILSLAYLLFGAMYFLDNSELFLDETGIARRILGRVRMHIAWAEIKVIREEFFLNKRYGGEIRIDILPIASGDFALRVRRTIAFSDQFENFDELIDTLNQRIKEHSLRVEVRSEGVWKRQSGLVTKPERRFGSGPM